MPEVLLQVIGEPVAVPGLCLVLGFLLGYRFQDHRVTVAGDRLSAADERLRAAEASRDEWRERAEIRHATESKYRRLTNRELKEEAHALADRIMTLDREHRRTDMGIEKAFRSAPEHDDAERDRRFEEKVERSRAKSDEVRFEYEDRYAEQARQLRKEMEFRLGGANPLRLDEADLQVVGFHFTSAGRIDKVAQHLRGLADALPDTLPPSPTE